jgi:ankyrin repeat protein
VKLLLENGAEVNAEGGEYGNALQAASFRGNEAIVKLLLENGAEVNAEGGNMGMHSRQHHIRAMRQL